MKLSTNNISWILCLMISISCDSRNQKPFSSDLMSYCQSLPNEFISVPDSTRKTLIKAGEYIITQLNNWESAKICFVCQHNSRKSHLGQVWTEIACLYYRFEDVNSYSGGITSTYVNWRIITALENTGFRISQNEDILGKPIYYLDYGDPSVNIELFSKRYNHPGNPDTNYLAISLCNNPEECCPISLGADEQLTIPYDDLQEFDNTTLESMKYDEQCRIIARDMFFMMDYVNQNMSQ